MPSMPIMKDVPSMPSMPAMPSSRRMKLWPGKKSAGSSAASPAEEKGSLDMAGSGSRGKRRSSDLKGDSDEQPDAGKQQHSLAADIKARRKANERLYTATEAYYSHLSKKELLPFELSHPTALQTSVTLDEAGEACSLLYPASSSMVAHAARESALGLTSSKDKLLPVESVGVAMASSAAIFAHSRPSSGEDKELHLVSNQAFASHLGHLAGVHLALGRAQAAFTESLSSTLLSRLARMQATVESLRTAEKTCEYARERMEVAERKRGKARDKDESKRELEEEARLARASYEDAYADVVTRVAILTETEQSGPGAGTEMVKGYLALYTDWIDAQREILLGAQTALNQYQGSADGGPPSTARSQPKRGQAPAIPRRWDQPAVKEDDQSAQASHRRVNSSPKKSRSASAALLKTTADSRPPSLSGRGGNAGRLALTQTNSRTDSFTSVKNVDGSASLRPVRSRSDSASKIGSRLTSVLGRSGSSKDLPKMAQVQKNERISSSESNKNSSWTSSLLALKRDPTSRTYKTMNGKQDGRMLTSHGRDLSHVREGTDQSYEDHHDDDDGVTFGADPARRHSSGAATERHDLGPSVGHADSHDMVNYSAEPPQDNSAAEGLDDKHRHLLTPTNGGERSLAPPSSSIDPQWTGFSAVSSDGGDPFGGGDPASPRHNSTRF